MPDVETKVSTVFVRLSGLLGRCAQRGREHGRWSYGRFKLLPDGNKTEIHNKKKVKERSNIIRGHLRSNYNLSGHMTVEIRAFSDFEKISIFISEFSFYFLTKEGFQIKMRILIGWDVPSNQKSNWNLFEHHFCLDGICSSQKIETCQG